MILSEYVRRLQEQLVVTAETGGDQVREVVGQLVASLDATTRLVLLQALSEAADEITRELAPGNVEVRLRGGEPEFVVTPPPSEEEFEEVGGGSEVETATLGDDSESTRLNLRLSQSLKQRIEEAARAEGLSLNAWLVRAATSALTSRSHSPGRPGDGGERFTGWVR